MTSTLWINSFGIKLLYPINSAAVKINSIKNKKERGVRQLGELRVGLHKRAFLFWCCLVERVLERARARE